MPAKPLKHVKAFKHKGVSRAHIPSAEEAGYEDGSDKVVSESTPRDFPRNPVVHRGQDPELFWLQKYGPEDDQDRTPVDIRSLYRTEHIAPETLIKNLYRYHATEATAGPDLPGFSTPELFGNAIGHEELDKVSDYYTHSDGWTNRLIQGDSLLVLTSNTAPTGKSTCTTAPSRTAMTTPSPANPNKSKPSATLGNSASTPTSPTSATASSPPANSSTSPAPASSRSRTKTFTWCGV